MIEASSKFTYKAFISYKHSDIGRRHAVALETGLKRYAKPLLQRPVKLFRDEKHMVPGNNLSDLITDGLNNSEYLIFIAEKGSAQSTWCKDELEYWCNNLNRTENLIIVHADDIIDLDVENNKVDWADTDALPDILQKYISSIPLYVDLNWTKQTDKLDLDNSKYKTAINLITAKLRGVAPEELNDEELRVYRRNRRLRNGAIIVLFLLFLVSIFASLFAVDRQKAAESSAKEAQDSSIVAQNQRALAIYQKGVAEDSTIAAQEQREIAVIEAERRVLAETETVKEKYRADSLKIRADIAAQAELLIEAHRNSSTNPGLAMSILCQLPENTPLNAVPLAWKLMQTTPIWASWELRGHMDDIFSATYSKNGRYVATGGGDGVVKVWPLDKTSEGVNFSGHNSLIIDLEFSPDSKLLATSSEDDAVRVWQLDSKKLLAEYLNDNGQVNKVSFNISGQLFACGSYNDLTIRRLPESENDLGNDWELLSKFDIPDLMNFEWSPDGNSLIAVSSSVGALFISSNGTHVDTLKSQFSFKKAYAVKYSQDGNTVAVGWSNGSISIFSTDSKREIKYLKFGEVVNKQISANDIFPIKSIGFSNDGSLFYGSVGPKFNIWDASNFSLKHSLNFPTGLRKTIITKDNKYVIGVGYDKYYTWKIEKKNKIFNELIGTKEVDILAHNPTQDQFLTNGSEGAVKLWEYNQTLWPVDTLKQSQSELYKSVRNKVSITPFLLPGQIELPKMAIQSPDKTQYATIADDYQLRVWNADKSFQFMKGNSGDPDDVAYSADSKTIITKASYVNDYIHIWSADDKKESIRFTFPWLDIQAVEISPNGKKFLTKHSDGGVLLWSLDWLSVRKSICSRKLQVWSLDSKE